MLDNSIILLQAKQQCAVGIWSELSFINNLLLTNNKLWCIIQAEKGNEVEFMWNSNKSINLSLAVCFLVFLLLIFGAVSMPFLLKMYFGSFASAPDHVLMLRFKSVLICFYVCLLPAFIALLSLVKMLFAIKREEIFTSANILRLRILSWCCFAVAFVTAVGCIFYVPLVVVAVAAGFIGLIIRVIKNVICSAKILREENELTI